MMGWVGALYAGGKATYDAIQDDQKRLNDGAQGRLDNAKDYIGKRHDWMAEAYNTNQSDAFQGALGSRAHEVDMRQAPQATYGGPMSAAHANAATINTAQSDASRANQLAAYNMWAQQAAGKGPSMATQQMNANVDAANAANMAFAASARGHVNPMLAARQASMSNAANIQAGARDSAMLRTQEQMNAQNQMFQAAYGMRTQDMQGAQAQAGMNQQASLANAGFQQQAGMFNVDAQQKIQLANMEAQLRARGMNDAAIAQYLSMSQSQMNYDKQAKLDFHARRTMGDQNAQQFYAQLGQQASQYNQDRTDKQMAGWAQAGAGALQYGASSGGGGGVPSGSDTSALAAAYDKSDL